MRLLGVPVPFTRGVGPILRASTPARIAGPGGAAVPAEGARGWTKIFESFTGAWQHNVVVDRDTVLTYSAVYACVTLIASDVSKLRVLLVKQDANGIWQETENPAYSPVLRKPNPYQNRIQFWENWMLSKLTRGNTYALKERDNRGVVIALYILDPDRTFPMIADDGSVFYRVCPSRLNGLPAEVLIPAREIIHDRFNCLFHPLVGTSPIWASGIAATQGMAIQNSSAAFFANASQPGGILTAPGAIADNTAVRLKATWEENFSGAKAGRVAVLGDGLKYERLSLTSVEAQLIEQLKWTADVVCSTFHVPPYKIGVGAMPTYNNIQSLNVEYYSQCLQALIEAAELCLDEGLGMANDLGTEFDTVNLLRMDSVTQMQVLKEGVGASVLSPNEARRRIDLPPVIGGESPMAQQQNYSLAALARRDAAEAPPPSDPANPAPANEDEPDDPDADPDAEDDAEDEAKAAAYRQAFVAEFQEALNV